MRRRFGLLALLACLGGCASSDCSEGTQAEYRCAWDKDATSGSLKIELGAPVAYDSVQVRVYEGGSVESGKLFKCLTLTSSSGKSLSYGEEEGSYSARAIYWKGGVSVEAIDGGSISVSRNDHCTCYTMDVSDASLDLVLEAWPH